MFAKFFLTVSLGALMAFLTPATLSAGSINPASTVTTVDANQTDRFQAIYFRAGEEAIVEVIGDGTSDLDLYVYDQNGNLIAKDDDSTDHCVVRFVPRWTGAFHV